MFLVKLYMCNCYCNVMYVHVMELLTKIYLASKYMSLYIIELYIPFYKVKVTKCCLGFSLVTCTDIVSIAFK